MVRERAMAGNSSFPRIPRTAILFYILFLTDCARSEVLLSAADSTSAQVKSVRSSGMMFYPVAPGMQYGFSRPRSFSFATNFPRDMRIYFSTAFRKRNFLKIGAVAAGTGLLLALDQPLVDGAQHLAKHWHIPSDTRQKAIVHIGKFPVFVPASTGSMLYYIGDGTTHFLIAGTFMTYGFIAKDNRSLQTASQLAEGLLTVGTLVQVLKHITGHETPATATVTAGRWRFFPNQADYLRHVSKYDAYPSGHLATAMMCVTVISRNYPEKAYIRPLGYSLMTILAFQMMNNGVHWASDYPLAVALGYSFGKIIQSGGHAEFPESPAGAGIPAFGALKSLNAGPAVMAGGIGFTLSCGF